MLDTISLSHWIWVIAGRCKLCLGICGTTVGSLGPVPKVYLEMTRKQRLLKWHQTSEAHNTDGNYWLPLRLTCWGKTPPHYGEGMVLGTFYILRWESCSVHKEWWLASQVFETANSTHSWGCSFVWQWEEREGGRKETSQSNPKPIPNNDWGESLSFFQGVISISLVLTFLTSGE